jgi:hypothetical protein
VPETEAGVLGELRLRHRGQCPVVPHVVHATDGDAPGVGEGWDHHDAIGRLPGYLLQCCRDHVRFEGVMSAQRGVAATDETRCCASLHRGCQCVGDDFAVPCCGLDRFQAAGIGQHVHGGGGLPPDPVRECPAEVILFPASEHRNVGHGLRTGGVVVEDYQYPVRGGHGSGDGRGCDRHLDGETSEQVGLKYQRRLRGGPIAWVPQGLRRNS